MSEKKGTVIDLEKGGEFWACSECDARNIDHGFLIGLNPLSLTCQVCGALLHTWTADEQEEIQQRFVDAGEPKIGESVCGDCGAEHEQQHRKS